MYSDLEKRVKDEAAYCLEHHATVREIAKKFRVSKSTVHKDLTIHLCRVQPLTVDKVRKVLSENKDDMHRRGGEATKRKWGKH